MIIMAGQNFAANFVLLYMYVDYGMKVDVVYTDIAKAFDTVSHSKLLLKIEVYGFKSNLHVLQWIRAFLNNRTQCVYVGLDVHVSSPTCKSITSGACLRVLSLALSCFCYMSMTFLTMSNLQQIFADDIKLYLGYTENQNTYAILKSILFMVQDMATDCCLFQMLCHFLWFSWL